MISLSFCTHLILISFSEFVSFFGHDNKYKLLVMVSDTVLSTHEELKSFYNFPVLEQFKEHKQFRLMEISEKLSEAGAFFEQWIFFCCLIWFGSWVRFSGKVSSSSWVIIHNIKLSIPVILFPFLFLMLCICGYPSDLFFFYYQTYITVVQQSRSPSPLAITSPFSVSMN